MCRHDGAARQAEQIECSRETGYQHASKVAGRARPLTEAERASYERIAAVLKDTVRAGSAVECMKSVPRMQQSRHRRMT